MDNKQFPTGTICRWKLAPTGKLGNYCRIVSYEGTSGYYRVEPLYAAKYDEDGCIREWLALDTQVLADEDDLVKWEGQ